MVVLGEGGVQAPGKITVLPWHGTQMTLVLLGLLLLDLHWDLFRVCVWWHIFS